MFGPTWLVWSCLVELKLSNQMEKKTKHKRSRKWMERQIKDDAKLGKYESKLNPYMRRCGAVKTCKSQILS